MKILLTTGLLLAPFFSAPASPAASLVEAGAPARAAQPSDSRTAVISGHATQTWNLLLAGGVPALIVVDGDGDSDLDAVLYDENGNMVDFDIDSTDYCVLSVTPRWSGPFTLEIRNVGARANLYELTVD